MLSRSKTFVFLFTLLFLVVPTAMAQNTACRTYKVRNSPDIALHDRSFVDEVICPKNSPECPNRPIKIKDYKKRGKYLRNTPEDAVGPPPRSRKERKETGRRPYALGCGGYAIWKFTDNVIVDIEGPDILVFEAGLKAEATTVELSKNGIKWIIVGKVEGKNSSIDIASPNIKPSEQFRYIKLTDLGVLTCGRFLGADIIAIATYAYSHTKIGGSDIFFPTGKSFLKPKGKEYIDGIFANGPPIDQKLVIVGHTDSDNLTGINQQLSEGRAKSVAAYIISRNYMKSEQIKTFGMGASQPAAPNTTVEGKAKNRRVELTFTSPCQHDAGQ